jgi:integrase
MKFLKTGAKQKQKHPKKEGRGRKGEGSLRFKNGRFYYRIADPQNPGKQLEGSCETSDYQEAIRAKARAIANAKLPEPLPVAKKGSGVTVAKLLKVYFQTKVAIADNRYAANPDFERSKYLFSFSNPVDRVSERLGHIPANELTTEHLETYRADRESGKYRKPVLFATVNSEFRILRAALNRGFKATPQTVFHVPHFETPCEKSRIRKGFITMAKYQQIIVKMPDSLKALFVCGFHVGARLSELRLLRWSMVDLDSQLIEIPASTNKTQEGRYIPIWGDMVEFLRWQKTIHDDQCPDSPWVFFWHLGAPTKAETGARISQSGAYTTMKKAFRAAGHGDRMPHDLRRSAIKYATQEAKILESDVKLMSGHQTDSVFIRYNIKGANEMKEVGQKLTAHRASTGIHLLPPAQPITVRKIEPGEVTQLEPKVSQTA